jgi:hypothetical protein
MFHQFHQTLVVPEVKARQYATELAIDEDQELAEIVQVRGPLLCVQPLARFVKQSLAPAEVRPNRLHLRPRGSAQRLECLSVQLLGEPCCTRQSNARELAARNDEVIEKRWA